MDASQLVDAVSTSLFSLLGIWAAVVRRHWFLRMAAVGSVLLLALLIPAYELVIEFGVQLAVIAGVLSLRRGRSSWQPRMSLETAMLAMVVVAVIAAVFGATPHYRWNEWFRRLFIGVSLGTISLLCLWIACGRARLAVRISLGALGVVAFIALFHLGIAVSDANDASRHGKDWATYLVNCYRPDFLLGWLSWVGPSIALGVVILLTVLSAARMSGWFGERAPEEPSGVAAALRTASRVALCLAFAAIAAPNFYLLYRLCTPPRPLPKNIAAENGYDDLVAAGKIKGIDYSTIHRQDLSALSDEDLAKLESEFQPVFDRIDTGLSKPSWVTCAYEPDSKAQQDQDALIHVVRAMELRLEPLRRQKRWRERVAQLCRYIELAHASSRGHRSDYAMDASIESSITYRLQTSLDEMTAQECRELVNRLLELEQLREPYELKVQRQRVFDHRQSWQSHFRFLIRQWNGENVDSRDDSGWQNVRDTIGRTRVLIADAAIEAYWLDHGKLPDELSDLVPNYLPEIPADPLSDKPLVYKGSRRSYRVYSVGPDGEDDGGIPETALGLNDGDIVAWGPHRPAVPDLRPDPLREAIASAANRVRQFVQAAATAAEKATPPTAPR